MATISGQRPANARRKVRSTSGINLIAGLWLILAPFVLGYAAPEPMAAPAAAQAATWNAVIVGIAITVLSLMRVALPFEFQALSWMNFALGIWLLAAPFLLGYARINAALWNDIVIGLVVLALAASSALITRSLDR